MTEEDIQRSALLMEEGVSSARATTCNVLKNLIHNNIVHFRNDKSSYSTRFHTAFVTLESNLIEIEPLAEKLRRIAPEFDYDAFTHGNGYRSFIAVLDSCILQCIRLCRYICQKRSSFVFRSSNYCCEVEAYAATLGSIKVHLNHLETLSKWSGKGSLYPDEKHSAEELLKEAEKVDHNCFYGRCLGFQFCESMRKPLLAISILMASFSEVYYNTESGMLARTASSLLNCGRYVISPEDRARRIVEISQNASVDFCKAFWQLQETEVMQQLPAIVCPQVCVNKVFTILPEPMEVPKYEDEEMIDIPIPMSHIGATSMYCRLLSAVRREGQLNEQEAKAGCHVPIEPLSSNLIIQCHGGGFVAQSSKSHEVYLRDWARQLNVPILCIDYSLAPLSPYPRALEECVYVYSWALKNVFRLGSTGEKIIFVGDSAGGNLMFGLAMKTIELGIRGPDAIFAIYTPMLVDFVASPSRLLCLMDPLLPFGFMMRCLKAYAGEKCDEIDQNSLEDDSNSMPNSSMVNSSNSALVPVQVLNFSNSNEEGLTGDVPVTPSPLMRAIDNLDSSQGIEWKNTPDIEDVEIEGLKVNDDTVENKSTTSEEKNAKLLQNVSLSSEDGFKTPTEDYVGDFVGLYGSDTDIKITREEDAEAEENIIFEMPIDLSMGFSDRLSNVTNKVVRGISSFLPVSSTIPTSSENGGVEVKQSMNQVKFCMEEFKKFKTVKDPYMSPYLASDEILKKLPRISFLSLQLDPCLDDSIMFCKRLRALGKDPRILILDKLPHGFLSFSLVSRDAYDGSRVCVNELQRLMSLEEESDLYHANVN